MKLGKPILLLSALLTTALCVEAQTIYGEWKTIDDETGEAKSIVKIYEEQGKVYGKIVSLLKEEDKGKLCTKCEGDDKNEPIEGLVIIKDLVADDNQFEDGTIFDPKKKINTITKFISMRIILPTKCQRLCWIVLSHARWFRK